MKTAAQILRSKPDQTVHTMEPTASVYEAVRLMADKNIGALVVMEGDKVVGIVSERDYARKIVLMARSSKDTLLGDIMSSPVMYVHPDQTSDECMALMTENRLRHLPVMDGGRLIGLDLHRRPGQGHHLRAAVHHRATRALHLRAAGLMPGRRRARAGAGELTRQPQRCPSPPRPAPHRSVGRRARRRRTRRAPRRAAGRARPCPSVATYSAPGPSLPS